MPKKKTEPVASNESELKSLFDTAHKNVKKLTGREFISLDKIDAKYGIPGYFSTGLHDLDLILMHNADRTEYGIPRGRVTEIHGESESFKSTLCYMVAADCLAQGGHVYWIPTEYDFSAGYAREFIHNLGIPDEIANAQFHIRPLRDISTIFKTMKGLLDPFDEFAEKYQGESVHRVLPPILFVIDSLGSLESKTDIDRLAEDFDQGGQTGSYAGEMHKLMHYHLELLAKLGATLICVNHYRSDLGPSRKTRHVAHEASIRYYASLRFSMNAWRYSPLSKNANPTRKGIEYAFGRQIACEVYKKRQDMAVAGTTNLIYQYNHGFDYLQSVVNVLTMTGVAQTRKEIEIEIEDDPVLAELNGKYDLRELKKRLAEDPERVEVYAKRAMMRGPLRLDDRR